MAWVRIPPLPIFFSFSRINPLLLTLLCVLFGHMHLMCIHYRQQIEDCEREVSRLKELIKKKEENEKKYQGLPECLL